MNMMLALAIGDAYGAGFEYAPRSIVEQHNTLRAYIQHQKHAGIKPGMYTDDTQMSLAVAEHMLSAQEWTPLALAERFVDVFHRDPREGYASRFYDFLQKTRSGENFLENILPHSDKSGAAMRAVPIGLYASIDTVKAYSALQATITHDTPGGIASAVASSLACHYCRYQLGPVQDLLAFVAQHTQDILPNYPWQTAWASKVGSKGMDSAHAALYLLTQHVRMSDLLKACIGVTGDVDTVATIALGIAAHCEEYTDDMPQVLVNTLENGVYGRDYLCDLDKHLQRQFSG